MTLLPQTVPGGKTGLPTFLIQRFGQNGVESRLSIQKTGAKTTRLWPGQMARLKKIFSGEVCDWSKPGVGQTGVVAWSSFGPAPENQVFDVTKSSRGSAS
jgi:Tannase-like family of unknown function (DUF6351)